MRVATLLAIALLSQAVFGQAVVAPAASASAGGSTSGSTSGSASGGASAGVSGSISVPTPSINISGGVSGGASAGGSTSGSASTSGSTSGSASAGGSTSGSASSSGSGSTGGSIRIRIGGSSSGSAAASVDLTGTCPQASLFSIPTQATAATSSSYTMCRSNPASCCTAAGLTAYKTALTTFQNNLSHAMWSGAKVPTLVMTLLSNLKADYGAPAAANTNSSSSSSSSRRRRVLQAVVAPAPAASASGSTSGSAGVSGSISVPTPSVNVSGGVSGGASAGASGSSSGSASGSAGASAGASGSNAVTTEVVPAASGSGSASGSASGSSSGSASGSASGSSSGSVSGGVSIRVNVRLPSNPKPSTFQTSSTHRAAFVAAWNSANTYAAQRSQWYTNVQKCFVATMKLKAQMACAACDNRNSANFATKANVNSADVADLQVACAGMFQGVGMAYRMLKDAFAYVAAVTNNSDTTAITSALTALADPNVTACFPAAPAAAADSSSSSSSSSSSTPASGSSSSSTSRRRLRHRKLQAVVPTPAVATVTVDSWSAWKSAKTTTVATAATPSAACMSSTGVAGWVTNMVYHSEYEQVNTMMEPAYNALEVAFHNAATEKGQTVWRNFKGTLVRPSVTPRLRQMQAVTPTAVAEIVPVASGANLATTQTNTGFTSATNLSAGADQVAPSAAKISVFSALLALAFMMMN